MKSSRWLLILIVVGCISCEKNINLNLNSNPRKLVIEGLVTDGPGPYKVTVRSTITYSASDSSNLGLPIQSAILEISDDQGNRYSLKERSPGDYQTDSATFRGVIGRSYSLSILTAGKHYVSKPEQLFEAPHIDHIFYTRIISKPGSNDGSNEDFVYRVYIDYTDPKDTVNFYRWRFATDGVVALGIEIDKDQFRDGRKIKSKSIGGGLIPRNKDLTIFQVQQLSLTREAYLFWNNVKTESDPSNNAPYDTPPAPLVGNLYNPNDPTDYVLGYFEVSGIYTAEITIRK